MAGGVDGSSKQALSRRVGELVDVGWLTRAGRGDRFDPYRDRVA